MTSQFKSPTAAAAVAGGALNGNGKSGKLYKSQFDVATILIRVTDINDHAPEFRPGSCYPLAIPENSEISVIHRVVATDLDEGPNGDITYSITGTELLLLNFLIYIFFCILFGYAYSLSSSTLLSTFFRINGFSNSIYIFSYKCLCSYFIPHIFVSRLTYIHCVSLWPQTDQTFNVQFLDFFSSIIS